MLPCLESRSVGAAAVQRDAADQVERAQQLIVGHRFLRRLVGIAGLRRGRLSGGRLVVLFIGRLGFGGFVILLVGRLVGGLAVRVGDRAAQVLLAVAGGR